MISELTPAPILPPNVNNYVGTYVGLDNLGNTSFVVRTSLLVILKLIFMKIAVIKTTTYPILVLESNSLETSTMQLLYFADNVLKIYPQSMFENFYTLNF